MAEEELNYASVVFKKKNSSRPEVKKEEETVYDQVKVHNDGRTAELVPEKKANSRCFQYQHLACCLGTFCLVLLFGIIAYVIYNNKVTNLTAENKNLQLKNQQLEMDKKNLTAQLENKETAEMELNISRAQWSYDQYCKINDETNRGCQDGWRRFFQSNSICYAVNNAAPSDQRSWEKAREDCRGKVSDLVVVVNDAEKKNVTENSWPIDGVDHGYWLGLRVEDGKWKWVDGHDLTDVSWIQQHPATEGQCAISFRNGWKSVSCTEKKPWICKKKGLTL
ncbi:CD209 antigen-like protein E isoform X3 [Parambassis ranga]|uniref:CD209 antigen-like protein E isoform X3 n=1 Tax=Parambassis ranga TaxID=210632 RepID=A0A6P7K3Z3_9TELE|nr:CD209 antigen-like protein E isoform X3 [Parambassis ranga]